MTKNPEGLVIDFGGKVSFYDDEFSYGTPVIYEDINSPVPALYGKKKDCVLVENACGTGDVEVSMRTKKTATRFKCNIVVIKTTEGHCLALENVRETNRQWLTSS
jgi:hypothetical protein